MSGHFSLMAMEDANMLSFADAVSMTGVNPKFRVNTI